MLYVYELEHVFDVCDVIDSIASHNIPEMICRSDNLHV